MKYRTLLFFILLFLPLFLTFPLSADTPVKVGVYLNSPLVFWDSAGRVQGIYIDVLEYIAAQEGWQLEYVPGSWRECLERLEKGEIDLLVGIGYSEERDEKFDFTNETLLSNWGQVYTRKRSGIESIPDLQGKRVAVLTGGAFYATFKDIIERFDVDCQFVEADDYATILQLVAEETVHAGLVTRLYGLQHEKEYNVEKSPIICCPIELRFAVPEGKNYYLLNAIDMHLVALKENGNSVYYQSLSKWLEVGAVTGVSFPAWLKWALVGAGGLVVLLLGGTFLLRGQVQARTKELEEEIVVRKEAEAEVQRRLQEVLLLNRVTTLIASSVDTQDALCQVCAELARFLRVPQAGFALLNPERTSATVIADYHQPDDPGAVGVVIPVENNPSMVYVLENKAPLVVAEAQTDPRLAPVHEVMRQRHVQSILIVPVVVEGEVIGTLGFDAFQKRVFDDSEIELVQNVASQLGQTLKRKQAEEALRRERDLAKALERAASVVNSTLDLDQVLDYVLEQVCQVVPNDATNIMLIEGEQARIVRWRGYERFGAEEFVSTVAFNISDAPNLRQMVESKEPMFIADTATYPGWVHVSEQEWLRSYAAAPIVVRDKVIGFLNVDSATPGFFTQAHAEDLRAFAGHVAAAIENARLYEAERRRRAELETLHQASLQLTSTLELSPVLEAILDYALKLMGADDAHIFLYDGQRLTFGTALWAGGYQLDPYSEPRPHGLTYTVARSGERIVVSDVNSHPLFQDYRWGGAIIGLPLRIGERVVGVMTVAFQQPHDFDENEVRILELLADQAAIAIENARLFEEAQSTSQRLAVVNRIAKAVGATLQLDDLMETVYQEITSIFEADAFFIALYDEENGELDFRLRVDQGQREPPERRALGIGLTSWVITEGKPLLVRDLEAEKDNLPPPQLWGTMEWPSSWLGVPMRISGRVLGVICVQAYRPYAYDEQEQLLLSTVADQVAVAVENARLYEAVWQELVERKQAEEALRESEEKYRNLVERANDGIVIVQDRLLKYANPRVAEIMGYTAAEMINTSFTDYVYPDELPKVLGRYERRMAGEEVEPIYETALRHRDGRRIEVELNAGVIMYQGRPADLVFVRDITERKRVEAQVRRLLDQQIAVNRLALALGESLELNEIYHIIYEHVRELMDAESFIVSFYDAETRLIRAGYVVADEEVLDVTGFPPIPLEEEGRGTQSQVIRSGEPLYISDYRQAVKKTGTQYSFSEKGIVVEGEPLLEEDFTRSALYVPMKIEGETIGVMQVQSYRLDAYTQDDIDLLSSLANVAAVSIQNARLYEAIQEELAERQRLEEQLLQSQKMEAVGRLAGGVAHDFNNILTAIIGYSEFLLMSLEPGDPLYRDVAEIKKAADRAADLTSQLLAFSRKQIMQPKVLDLNITVDNMGKMLRRLIGEDIQLVIALEPALGRVKADPGQVEQVIMNLAVNARDAMPEGGRLTIETRNVYLDEDYARQHLDVQPGPYVMLAISDTGVGMDEETQSHLFEPFFTTKDVGKGTGLGLATVYGIVKQSGGHIEVESEVGTGTTFKIYLPQIEEEGDSARQTWRPDSPLSGRETILLVEDEEVVRDLARRVLAQSGYTVLQARHGQEALQVCKDYEGTIHLLVTDVVMPGGMSGRQLAEQLIALRPEMKIMYISGYTGNAIAHHGVLDSGTAFLQKPFSPAELTKKVREVLDLS